MSLIDAMSRYTQAFTDRLRLPLDRRGQLLTRVDGTWESQPIILPINIAHSGEELDTLMGSTESFADVFNTWQRISRWTGNPTIGSETFNDDYIPAELTAWTYDSPQDRIRCTINSESLVGFLSPQRFENYTYEVVLRSTNNDDDFIGLCIAHAYNAQEGYTEILTAIRGLNGTAPLMIERNGRGFDRQQMIRSVRNGLKWPDGTVATEPRPGYSDTGWNLIPDGIKLKVERAGDIVTVSTSQYDDTEYFEPATTVIDLSSMPELEVFRGPQRTGYVCSSQNQSTWETLQRPIQNLPILDVRDYTLWTHHDGVWSSESTSFQECIQNGVLIPKWMVVSPGTQRFYYVDSTELQPL